MHYGDIFFATVRTNYICMYNLISSPSYILTEYAA